MRWIVALTLIAGCLSGCGVLGKTTVTPPEYRLDHRATQKTPTHERRTIIIDTPRPPEPAKIIFDEEPAMGPRAHTIAYRKPAPPPEPVAVKPDASISTVRVDGVDISAPAGSSIKFETETTYGGEVQVEQSGTAKGAGLNGSGAEMAAKFDAAAPDLKLPGGEWGSGGSGGGGAFSSSMSVTAIKGLNFFHWLGGIALLVAVGVWWFGRPVFTKIAIGIAVVGAASIGVGVTISTYPWVWLIALAAMGGMGVWFVVNARSGARTTETLDTIVEAVEEANGSAAPVKASIKKKASEKGVLNEVKSVVSKSKSKIRT